MNENTRLLLKCQKVVDTCKEHQKEVAMNYLRLAKKRCYNNIPFRIIYMGMKDIPKVDYINSIFKDMMWKVISKGGPPKCSK